jgi:hypothetical protein
MSGFSVNGHVLQKQMKNCTTLVLLACATALVGCANWAPPVTTDQSPNSNLSYVYGDFKIDTYKNAFGQYQSLGLNLTCADGSSYIIKFRKEDTLQVIPIKPSKCGISELVYTNIDGIVKNKKPFAQKFLQDVDLKPATAYYFGDYEGEASTSVGGGMINYRWRITSIKEKYAETTERIKTDFPKFSGIATENLLKIPVASNLQ